MRTAAGKLILLAGCGLWACSLPGDPGEGPYPAQASFEPYLGYPAPGDSAVIFAPGVVSVQGRFEFGVSFSPDGRELLFTAQVPGEAAGLRHLAVTDGRWSEPRRIQLAGGQQTEEMEAFFTPDGKRVYFAAFDEGMTDVRIWAAAWDQGGWTRPRRMVGSSSHDPAFYPTSTADGTLYFSNLAHGTIYRGMVASGRLESAEDTGLDAMHAFISPDESFALLDVREGEGDSDLFVAFRSESGSWSEPAALGSGVNTGFHETCPSLSPDGRYIFFSRYSEPNGVSDIYWVSAELISRAREEAGGK